MIRKSCPVDRTNEQKRVLIKIHRFMYHQANMRHGDTNNTWTFGPVTGELSLLQIGTEVLAQEMMRLCVSHYLHSPIPTKN